jgi:hypothetical protein
MFLRHTHIGLSNPILIKKVLALKEPPINQFVSLAGVDYSMVDETIWRKVTKAPCGIFKFTGNCPFRCWPTETI